MISRFFIQVALLAILVGLTVAPIGVRAPGGRSVVPSVAAQTISPSQCHGDELASFAPTSPVVGQEMLVVVTSASTHRGVYLAASERATAVQETEGQLGRVWLWSLTPQLPGPHHFQFFVDFTILCVEATVNVAPSVLGAPVALPPGAPGLPPTTGVYPAQPPVLPLDDSSNSSDSSSNNSNSSDSSSNGNDNCSDSTNNDSNSNDSTSNDNCSTSTVTVATPPTPVVDSLLCTDSATHEVTISGRRFGEPQSEFSGRVLFVKDDGGDTFEASTYLSWKSGQVVALVPDDVKTGNNYTVYLVTLGGFDKEHLPSACRHET